MIKLILIPLCAAALLAGCSKPVVEVGNRSVSEEEFRQYLELKRISPENSSQVKRALEDFANREAMVAAIEKSDGFDTASLEAEINEFRKQLILSRYFDQFLSDTVSDAAIANFYAANPEKYQARKAKLAHILIRTRPEMSDEERAARLTTVTEALSRVKRGEDFGEVAQEMSEDKISAGKGGDLGWMKEGSVAESFSKAAFALSPGEVSGVVTTPFGFHVIKLVEGPQVVRQSQESVEGDIRYHLRQQAKDEESRRLRASVNLKVNLEEQK
ncbi:peptidylprolyl isomerase [Microbulbifer sp.]|uniref:peptidylprolyl isomerase n=1 Tax=Microbulbifer sp. TaxID=1908541 RepID=UPI003F32B831